MKFKPLHDRILIKPLDAENTTKSGIVIPDTASEKSYQGKVVAVGTGKIADNGNIIALSVKEGDTVLYAKYSGQIVKTDGEELVILKEDDIVAIVE